MMEKHNRKSHLAPQPSPATKAFLRSDDSASSRETLGPRTPTSGEIPIAGDIKSAPVPQEISHTSNRVHNPHPGYPIRTSSASTVPRAAPFPNGSSNHLPPAIPGTRASAGSTSNITTLPMRPAPPAGPLPPPPSRMPRIASYQVVEQHDVGDSKHLEGARTKYSTSDMPAF